jgi:2-polyprenyl-3-methyl-5-hydroxy-6-metoxy-1,4-benzoquinol methylase
MIYSHKSIELEYYIREGISPVHQNISDLNKHFQIRASLYRLLGLIPSLFKGKDIIEVAPGSGHNSIYTASLLPRTYDLVEPNPLGRKDISKIFRNLSVEHTKPNIFPECIEDFKSNKLYDIVICEGWLGGFLDYEKSMLIKLSSFVKPGGVMLITFFPPIGGMATFLRRLLGHRLISRKDKMKQRTNILKKAFSSHLNKLTSMSRSHEHWIQDSILNPHICVGLNTPRLCTKILGNKFSIYQSVPQFATDWRWYKSLHGKERKLTKKFLVEYDSISHCMIDFRMDGIKRSIDKNKELEKICFDFATITKNNENLGLGAYKKNVEPLLLKIIRNIESDLPQASKKSLYEANTLLKKKVLEIDDVAKMSEFSCFFGREQCYLSITKE